MDDDELALKIAERMWDTREKQFPPKTRIPFSYRQTDDMIDMARAALQVVKEEGWKPPAKPVAPTIEHITGVALREPPDRPGRYLHWFLPKPNRHHDVMDMMRRDNSDPNGCEQGFVTSRERFVTRLEAMPIAKAAGQLIRPATGGYQGPELFSEDLW